MAEQTGVAGFSAGVVPELEVFEMQLSAHQLLVLGYALSYTLPDGFSEKIDRQLADDLLDIVALKLRGRRHFPSSSLGGYQSEEGLHG